MLYFRTRNRLTQVKHWFLDIAGCHSLRLCIIMQSVYSHKMVLFNVWESDDDILFWLVVLCCCDQKFKIPTHSSEPKCAKQKSFAFLTENGITLCLVERWFPICQAGIPCECCSTSSLPLHCNNSLPLASPVNVALPIVCPCSATIVYPWHPLWMLLYQ